MSTEDLKFALLLRAARSIFNLSLKEVGEQVDVSPVAVGKWESGDAMIKASTFRALQKFFDGNGVTINFNHHGDAVVYIKQAGVELIHQNPKNPPVRSLQSIYDEELQLTGNRGDYGRTRHRILDQLETLILQNPDLLDKAWPQNDGEDERERTDPMRLLMQALLSTYRSEKGVMHPSLQPKRQFSEDEVIDPLKS